MYYIYYIILFYLNRQSFNCSKKVFYPTKPMALDTAAGGGAV